MNEKIPENTSFRAGISAAHTGFCSSEPQGPLASRDLGTGPPLSPDPRRRQPADGSRVLSTAPSTPLQTQAPAAPERGCEEGRGGRRRRSRQGSSHRSQASRRSPGCAPRRAPCAQARRPAGDPCGGRSREAGRRRGGPGGGAGAGEGEEEEREKGKEESRAGPPLPSPAPLEAETSRVAQPSPSASPTPKVRRRGPAARRPRQKEPVLQPPCIRPPELQAERAACSGGRRASSDL